MDASRYEIAQVIADSLELIVSDIYLESPDVRLDSLIDGFDIMGQTRLRRDLEAAFKVDIPWEDDGDLVTVQDVYDRMEKT